MLEIIIMIIAIIFLLIFSALFSGSETAIISLNHLRLKSMENAGLSKAKILLELLKKPHRLINSMLLGTNLSVVVATTISSALVINMMGENYSKSNELYTTLILTPIVLIFCEIIPKTIFRFRANILSLRFTHFINFFYLLFYPLTSFLKAFSNLFFSKNEKVSEHKNVVSKEQLKILLKMGVQNGALDSLEHRILYGIMEFGNKEAREIMTPRVDVIAFDVNDKIEKIAKNAYKKGFSRFPVYDGEIDLIRGVLYSNDIIHDIESRGKRVRDLMRKAYFVTENQKISEIMKEMKKRKIHMAIVIDEYGGMAGIISMDDILEEIFGELVDERDAHSEPDIVKKENGSIIINAGISIADFNEKMNLAIPESNEYETLAGYLFEIIGHVPNVGERVYIDGVGEIKIKDADPHRIRKVLLKKGE